MSTIQQLDIHLEALTEEESANQPVESAEARHHRTSSLSDLEYFQERERQQSVMASTKQRQRASSALTPDRIAAAASIKAGVERSAHARLQTFAHVTHVTEGVAHRRPRVNRLVSLLPELPEAFHENTQRVRAARRSVQVESIAFHAPINRKFSTLELRTQDFPDFAVQTEEPVENHSATGCIWELYYIYLSLIKP